MCPLPESKNVQDANACQSSKGEENSVGSAMRLRPGKIHPKHCEDRHRAEIVSAIQENGRCDLDPGTPVDIDLGVKGPDDKMEYERGVASIHPVIRS
jgi:hypothetical protein